MIFFVGGHHGIQAYLEMWGRPLAPRVAVLPYDDLWRMRRLPAGTYVFIDVDLLSPDEAERAALAWTSLAEAGMRPLNHPLRSLRRYELLRTLKERGLNSFDVYLATEARLPGRFPVFVREANDHAGPITDLLPTADALRASLDGLVAKGKSREGKVIIEFCDTADANGLYRKYSAQIVGDRVVPIHIAFSRSWMTKGTRVNDQDLLQEELDYVRGNPHEQALREIFALAHIDWGRIDYGVRDGVVQTWEINTNPYLIATEVGHPSREPACAYAAERLNEALAAVDSRAPSRPGTTNPLRMRWVRARQRRVLHAGLTLVGLTRHERRVIDALWATRDRLFRLLRGIRAAPSLLRRRCRPSAVRPRL